MEQKLVEWFPVDNKRRTQDGDMKQRRLPRKYGTEERTSYPVVDLQWLLLLR